MFDLQTPKQPSEDAIIVQNVSKHFRIPHEKRTKLFEHITGALKGTTSTYEEFWAVKDVSFTVKKGETLGIIGENGSGKSTLLKIIAGVLTPDSGSVKVNGKIAPFLELGVGFNPELTAEDNVRLYGAIMGMSKKEMEDKFEEIFEFADLEKFRNMKLKNFSSGMYARLAFATAAATDPDILLIDEVLSVGDLGFQRKCFERIDEFKRSGKTIVFVSHDTGSIKKLCKISVFLEHGEVRFMGTTEKVLYSYNSYMIDKEIREFNKSTKKDEPKDRWGTREIEILDVKTLDEKNIENHSFKTGDKIRYQISYKVNKDFSDPTFGFGLYANNGTYIYGTTTKLDDFSLKLPQNNGMIYLDIDNFLLSGTFLISVGVWSGDDWLKPYDVHDKMYSFKIIFDKKYDGIVKMPSKWSSN
ncbi:putative ABC transporter ATP-binding protein [uncultured archaeon]|nr:putative ABC transporter ATP-binding protein [uncultured archaeon]